MAVEHSITLNSMLLACMRSIDKGLDELAHLLTISRVFAALDVNKDLTFPKRRHRHDGGNVLLKGDVIRRKPVMVEVSTVISSWFCTINESSWHDGIINHVSCSDCLQK